MTQRPPGSIAQDVAQDAAPTVLPAATRARVFLYLGGLIVLLAFADPNGGLFDIPVSFFLKNKLNLDAREAAVFKLVAAAPLYVSFLFGLARDTWSPFGMRDRGFLLLFGVASAALYGAFAFVPVTYWTLLAAVMAMTASFLFLASAENGLASTLGQQHAMSGQVSAVWNVFAALPAVAALLTGGALSDWLETHDIDTAARVLFLTGAAISLIVAAYAALRPAAVFDNIAQEHPARAQPFADLGRLARWKPIYPAMAIWLLWNFAPGSTTSLQYHLQDKLRMGDGGWGQWNAIFNAAFIPTFALYGYLCQRVRLKTLLWIGTLAAVPQFVPLLFVQSPTSALVAAAPIGLMGGMATAAYLDLIIRTCPPGLQGTTMMLSGGLYYVSTRFGDVLGARLYESFGGFTVCVATITLAYAAILPLLRLVPNELIDTADGERR